MAVGVEPAARLDPDDAVTGEDGGQLALGRRDPGLDRIEARRVGRQRGDGAGKVVGDAEQVAGEAGHGIGRRVGLLAFEAAADVLGLGGGAEETVLEACHLVGQPDDLGRQVGRPGLGLARAARRGRVVGKGIGLVSHAISLLSAFAV